MKLIFAGPTLRAQGFAPSEEYRLCPPARQGDIYRAVEDGANVIGLIDGVYEHVPAIWHKEILYGLSKGVHMLGAASMGALRAAECRAFGMVGIGEVYEGYASGLLEDDADVAQSHAPAEMGFLPLSEPLVNVRATISRCLTLSLVSRDEHDRLQLAAGALFFKERTYRRLVASCIANDERALSIPDILRSNAIDLKLQDARLLVEAVLSMPNRRFTPRSDWSFEATHFWNALFSPG